MEKMGGFLSRFFMQEELLMKKLTEVCRFGVLLVLVVDRISESLKELHTQFQNKWLCKIFNSLNNNLETAWF